MAETVFSIDDKDFVKKLERLKKVGLLDFMRKEGAAILAQVKADTPVDKGLLRRSWKVKAVTLAEDVVELEISNPVDYADHVEHGHRIVTKAGKTVGYVPGVGMLDFSVSRFYRELSRKMEEFIEAEVRRIGLE
jgi:hypothetical protein